MIFGLFVLFTALLISGVAAWYSIVGLMAIFSGAALAIAIMGGVLEVGKLVTASWLYNYWKEIPRFLKVYLTGAVIGLMFITSMGIFGFLSKAHLEQTAMSDEQVAQISVLEGKIVRSSAKVSRWTDEIDRLNRGENVRVDNIIQGEEDQLQRLYDRIDDEKQTIRLTAESATQVLLDKIEESKRRTKDDIELVKNREDNQKEIDEIRKRDRGTQWVARRDIGVLNNQLKIDLLAVDTRYANNIDKINQRINKLKEKSNLKTEDIDKRVNELEGFIETEQVKVDQVREDKLVLEKTYRALEVEVGPVKYIAEFIYGDQALGMLDSAVRAVILLLIFVFDPLAVLLVIAGNMTIRQYMDRPPKLKPIKNEQEIDLEVAQNLGLLKEKKDDVRVEPEDIQEGPTPEEEPEHEPEPPAPKREVRVVEDVVEHEEEEKIEIREPDEEVGPEKDIEIEQNITEIKEILEKADPEVREEVAKELEKEEVPEEIKEEKSLKDYLPKKETQPVLVDKTNTPVVAPLIKKGRSLLKSLASGKPAKKSWIDNSHE